MVVTLFSYFSLKAFKTNVKYTEAFSFFLKEPFIQACMTFLKRRCPSILGGLAPEKDQPKSAQLPAETLATMLACLQACAG